MPVAIVIPELPPFVAQLADYYIHPTYQPVGKQLRVLDRILAILRERGPASRSEILEVLVDCRPNTVDAALRDGTASGQVERYAKAAYRLPARKRTKRRNAA